MDFLKGIRVAQRPKLMKADSTGQISTRMCDRRLAMFGYTIETINLLLLPMIETKYVPLLLYLVTSSIKIYHCPIS